MNPRDQDWKPDEAIAVPQERSIDNNGSAAWRRHSIAAGAVRRGGPAGAGYRTRRTFSLADLGPAAGQVARVVGRYWWVGATLAAIELVAFACYLSVRQPVETAEATLLAESSLDRVLGSSEATINDMERRENILRNHHSVMTSRRFQAQVAESLSATEAEAVLTPFLEPGEEPSPQRLRGVLRSNYSVERERGRELFTIRATHPEADVALMMADRFMQGYLGSAQGDFRSANDEAGDALREEAAAMDRSILELEAQRKDFQRRFDAITGGGGRDVVDERIRSLNTALSEVRVERAQAEVQLRQAERDLNGSSKPLNNPILAAYGNTAALRAEIDLREADRAVLAAHYGPNHPKRQEADRAIASLEEALQRNFSLAVDELRARVALAASEEEELAAKLNALFQQSSEVDSVAAELASLEQKILARRDAQADLLRRVAQAGIAAALPTDVMRIVDEPYIHRPMLPPNAVLAVTGLGGALALFIAGPLLWHASRRRVTSAVDLETELGTELLGVVPRLPWMWDAQRPHVVRRDKRPAAVEAFLATASLFELRSPDGCPRRIVLSSALPGEGKSVVASNLAAAFTRLGYRALLVDCDFRRPSQHHFHHVSRDAGLLRWLEHGCPGGADASFEAIGLQALPGGTWLLPAGGCDREPARHFLRPDLVGLFGRLGREFDVTIIDTSPAGLFPDAYFVTRFADVAALVVREGVASMDQLHKVMADFARTAAPVTGIVFNAISGGITHPSFGYRTGAAKYARHYGETQRPLPTRVPGRPPIAVEPVAS